MRIRQSRFHSVHPSLIVHIHLQSLQNEGLSASYCPKSWAIILSKADRTHHSCGLDILEGRQGVKRTHG